MTLVLIRRIRCDAPWDDGYTCMAEADHPLGASKAADLRAWLRRQGWRRSGGKDICPECWKEGKR